jgi:DNA-binding GntR family transcriptional regulator
MKPERKPNLADTVYEQIKRELFEFHLLPGDRLTESDVADRLGVSRTPVREALYRLQKEGYLQVSFRNGWQIRPFDFQLFENLYDLRIILESAAVRRLCESAVMPDLDTLKGIWLVPPERRIEDGLRLSHLDERFHETLIEATGNDEMARIHHEVTERIRIIRRFDFTEMERIAYTYEEHAAILRAILERQSDRALMLLCAHIESSKAEVRKITLHKLHAARVSGEPSKSALHMLRHKSVL